MGLRIVDRSLPIRTDISDAELLTGLERAATAWLEARGADRSAKAAYLDNFRRVRDRLQSPASMVEMAARVREKIRINTTDGPAAHQKVDVATLLELL